MICNQCSTGQKHWLQHLQPSRLRCSSFHSGPQLVLVLPGSSELVVAVLQRRAPPFRQLTDLPEGATLPLNRWAPWQHAVRDVDLLVDRHSRRLGASAARGQTEQAHARQGTVRKEGHLGAPERCF